MRRMRRVVRVREKGEGWRRDVRRSEVVMLETFE